MLESPCVARGTAALSVRPDIRDGHPAEDSTEMRNEGILRPTGRIGCSAFHLCHAKRHNSTTIRAYAKRLGTMFRGAN